MQKAHHARPHRRCARDTAHIPHALATGIAHPHAHGVALRIANRPVIPHVFARAGFHGAPKAGGEHAVCAESAGPCIVVAQHIAHDEAAACAERRSELGRWRRSKTNCREAPAIGQRAIGIGEAEQRHIGAAQRQAVAIKITIILERQTHRAQLLCKRFRRHHHQRAHRWHIERSAQRRAHAHPAFEAAVIVLRNVQAAGCGDVRRRIFEQRSSRDAVLSNGLGIQKRF